jgi:hypothetical protein
MVREHRTAGEKESGLDVIGAIISTAGLVGIVYGLLHAGEHPWGSSRVLLPLGAGLVLLPALVVVERRSSNPLFPPGFFANRTRSVVNVVTLLFMAAFISYTFMLTLFEQQVRGYSPLQGGLAWLPLSAGIGAGMALGTALIPRVGVKAVAAAGFVGAGAGLYLTSLIDVEASYLGGILPGMLVFGLFAGAAMPAATNAALHGVTGQDSSLAAGVQNTMQQVGAALGVAVLVTLAGRRAGEQIQHGVAASTATTSGYALSFRTGAILLVVGGVLLAALLERVDTRLRDPIAEVADSLR